MADFESVVRAELPNLRIPKSHDRVFKSECAYSYHTAESAGGLYTNLATLVSVGAPYVALDRARTGGAVYLHTTARRVPRPKPAAGATGADAGGPTKLAIGVAGGFAVNEPAFDVVSEHAVVVFTGATGDGADGPAVRLPHPDGSMGLPSLVTAVVDAVLAVRDTGVSESAAATWEDVPQTSKYADGLIQEASGRRISPRPGDWVCANCDKRDNLWLNLGDGHIGCGRKNWDGTGGNGHALAHFQASNGLYPLCVKLGTITAAGGDVYSYAPDEDDMVTDPHLARHLAHWGISVMELAKTEKSMAELNIDLNASYDFSRICEAGRDLVAVSGPGLIGCENLGNSCYMASVLQALAALPATVGLYVGGPDAAVARALFASTPAGGAPADDLLTQTAKVTAGLTTGAYAAALPPPPAAAGATAAAAGAEEAATAANAVALAMTGATSADAAALTHTTADDAAAPLPPAPGTACGFIVPRSFKTLIGRGHAEFASGRQQDAIEFFEYLLDQLDRAHHKHARRVADALVAGGGGGAGGITSLSQLFTFTFETRLRDLTAADQQQQHVRYGSVQERFWRLPIPLEAAVPLEPAPGADGGDDAASAAKRARGEGGAAISTPQPPASAAAPGAGGAPTKRVPFAACVQSWAGASELTDVVSFVSGARGAAAQTTRFASFPPVLVLQLGRYYTNPDWTTGKVDASVPMPLTLTLDRDADAGGEGAAAAAGGSGANFLPSFCADLKAKGPQPGETVHVGDKAAAPAAAAAAAPAPAAAAPPPPDPLVVAELESMGFPPGACARAAVATAGRGSEAAAEWVMAHMDDPDFHEPYVPAAAVVAAAPAAAAPAPTPAPAAAVDAGSLAMLCDMGFDAQRATYALTTTGGNLERAADWLFAHADEPLPAAAPAPAAAAVGADACGAGPMDVDAAAAPAAVLGSGARGVYDLTGVISHMGRSTASGHYVAHIRKPDGAWYLFNDAKVAVSQDPPLDLGYIYVYTRRDGGGAGSSSA